MVKVAVYAENDMEFSTGDLRESLDPWISSLGRGTGASRRRVMVVGVARVWDADPPRVCRGDLVAVGECATLDSTLVHGAGRLMVDVVLLVAIYALSVVQVKLGREQCPSIPCYEYGPL